MCELTAFRAAVSPVITMDIKRELKHRSLQGLASFARLEEYGI